MTPNPPVPASIPANPVLTEGATTPIFASNDTEAALDPTLQATLARIRVVLVGTSHAGNVGSTARAMKTMGLSQLWLVAPQVPNITGKQDAIALASGALDVLEQARTVPTLADALSGCLWTVASSGRLRELSPPQANARECARMTHARLHAHQPDVARQGELQDIAFVFGAERTGLSKEDVAMCNALCVIDGNPRYMSLNLSQAVQIVAYELRMAGLEWLAQAVHGGSAADAHTPASHSAPDPTPKLAPSYAGAADTVQVAGMLEHLEQALIAVQFLDPQTPKRLMPRLQRLFNRVQLEREEVDILRGIARAMTNAAQGKLRPPR